MNPVVQVVVSVLALSGAGLVLVSAVLMLRERDAVSRINCLSPATGLGLPLIVVAAYVTEFASDGVSPAGIIQLLVTLLALLVVSSVASNVLARAAYLSGAPVHPDTSPQDLARAPENGQDLDAGPESTG